MFLAILNHPRVKTTNMRSIAVAMSGASALPAGVTGQFEALTGATKTFTTEGRTYMVIPDLRTATSVTLNGNVTVGGSQNRIRGARITGNLSVPGSNFGMSFTRVVGTFQLDGSGATLLNNGFCSTVTINGSGRTLLGNAGMAPIDPPAAGC